MNEADFIESNPVDEQKTGGDNDVPAEESNESELQLTDVEKTAYDQGWRPQEEFEGSEDNWKTAKEYVKDGEWLGKIRDLNQKIDNQQKDFDSRLENTNKLNEARRQAEIGELKSKQRDAVEMGDTDAYDKSQTKIDNLEKQEVIVPPTVNKDPSIAAWEDANPWVNDAENEKAAIAIGIFNTYASKNPGATNQQVLEHLDGRLEKLYPAEAKTNPRRQQPNSTENNTKPTQRKGKDLAMSDLTNAEQNDWNMFGASMFGDQKTFLKAVADARKK